MTPNQIRIAAEMAGLERDHPAIVMQIRQEGAAMERERFAGLDAVAKDLSPRHLPLINAMKADGRCTGGDLAQAANAMRRQSPAHVTADRVTIQREASQAWAADPCLRKAFNSNERMYVEYRVAMANAA